ncbi:MAG: TetR/AcrR family transcriptional regulator [bacterium]
MTQKRFHREVRREQIAEAALRLVGDQGIKGLSIAALARRVGIVPSAIYRHFQGKEELLDAILELFQKKVMANVHAVKQETRDPLEQMRGLLMRHVELIRENEALPRIIFSEDVHHRSTSRRSKLLAIIKGLLGEVESMLREGQKAGVIRKDLDPSTLALVFLGLFQPAAVLWHLSQGEFDVTRHARRAWEVFRRGVEAAGVDRVP